MLHILFRYVQLSFSPIHIIGVNRVNEVSRNTPESNEICVKLYNLHRFPTNIPRKEKNKCVNHQFHWRKLICSLNELDCTTCSGNREYFHLNAEVINKQTKRINGLSLIWLTAIDLEYSFVSFIMRRPQ